MITTVLSAATCEAAFRLAQARHQEAMRMRLAGKFGGATDGAASLALHYLGALGECGAAQVLGFERPNSVNTFKAADLGTRLHVRTRSRLGYDLIVRPDDPDDALYVLCVIEHVELPPVTVYVVGTTTGRAAKQHEYSQTYGGRPSAFFVPASALTPVRA